MNVKKQFKEGLITNNPVLVQLLGMCSTMAITTTLFNGIGMGISVIIILTCSNIVISLVRKLIPSEIRIACYIVVVAGFVTIVDLLLQAYLPSLSESLGVFIPLIVVNCIILARAEAFASKNSVAASALDGIFQGLGYTPTHVKLSGAMGKVDTFIINAAECEPYITSDHRTLLEHPDEVLAGIRYVLKLLGLNKAVLGVEGNKQDAIEGLRQKLAGAGDIELQVLRVRYPQGSEKQLIQAVTGREVPPGGLPADVKCIVMNACSCYAVYQAVHDGMPSIERVVTVSGPGIEKPSNFLCRVGTPVRCLIEAAGGFKGETNKVLMGGPMMGSAIFDLEVPVLKGTNGVLAFHAEQNMAKENPACIRCGRCVNACPMHLQPLYPVPL